MQVDCVLLPRYKSGRKKIEKLIGLKRTVQELKTDLDVKIIFVNIYGLCRN